MASKQPLDFTGVDFPGHCNQGGVLLQLVFSWNVLLTGTMTVGEPKWAYSLGRGSDSNFGQDSGGYRTWGFCNLMLIRGMGFLDFVRNLQVIVTTVDVLLKLMFCRRY